MTAPALRLIAGGRDLLTLAGEVRELSLGLEFLARGLETAWQIGSDETGQRKVALRTLRKQEQLLSALIGEIEELVP